MQFMNINLRPDDNLSVEKIRIKNIPTLIIRPAKREALDVAVLWIHGGGYILGMKEMVYMSRAVDLVKKYGVTVYSPGYRLAFQKPYPAAVKDCWNVLRDMDRNRERTGLKHIMVGGESAGGGLSAAVCMLARDKGIKVAFQMPLYPMMSNIDTDSSQNNHGRVWNTRRNHIGWRFYLRGEAKKKVSPYAAPAGQTNYRNLPPCYSFVGDGEPFYRETLDYIRNLKEAGVEADLDVYPSDMHAFDMLTPEKEISRQAADSFCRHFEYALEHYLQ
jgi:acetyl esterase/lipase